MGLPDLEEVLSKLRASLKRRGADGIRGLGRHFKICDRNRVSVGCVAAGQRV